MKKAKSVDISVVIPVYNAATWLPETLKSLRAAMQKTSFAYEIIVVDDGSTDDISGLFAKTKNNDTILIQQENQGRYLARKTGVERGIGKYVLFIDARVHIRVASLKFLENELMKNADESVWNGHVYVVLDSNYAGFMDVLAKVGWWKYFKNPRRTNYRLEDFDIYPKGTTCFFAPRLLLLDTFMDFESQTKDIKNSSDDTHLIRIIAGEKSINIDPEFSCDYYSRSNIKQVPKHAYNRGKFFVDGFLRPGTRFFPYLIMLYLSSILAIPSLFYLVTTFGSLTVAILAGAITVLSLLTIFAVLLFIGVRPFKAVWGFALYAPIFFVFYFCGIFTASVKIIQKKVSM